MKNIGIKSLGLFQILCGLLGIIHSIISKGTYLDFGAPFLLVIGFGLLKLKELARKVAISFYILFIIYIIILIIVTILRNVQSPMNIIVSFIKYNALALFISGIIIYFLTRPRAKEQFK